MGGKRNRKKCTVIPGEGDPCPRCGQPMQIREYDGIDEKQLREPSYTPLVLLHEQDLQNDLSDARTLQSGVTRHLVEAHH